jgi:hypothetical protein
MLRTDLPPPSPAPAAREPERAGGGGGVVQQPEEGYRGPCQRQWPPSVGFLPASTLNLTVTQFVMDKILLRDNK